MSEVKDKCPKCGSGWFRNASEGYREWVCDSYSHLSGDCFTQSEFCKARARIAELEAALKEISEGRFPDATLHRTISRMREIASRALASTEKKS